MKNLLPIILFLALFLANTTTVYLLKLPAVLTWIPEAFTVVIAIIVNIPIILFFNKFLPILIGKKITKPLKIILDLNIHSNEDTKNYITT